jgi:hypothetical protein
MGGQTSPEAVEIAMRTINQPGAHSYLQTFGPIPGGLIELLGVPVADAPAVMNPTGEGLVAFVVIVTRRPLAIEEESRGLWQRIAIHLGAACRLADRAVAPQPEAVLDGTGKILRGGGARGDLRDAPKGAGRRARSHRPVPVPAVSAGRHRNRGACNAMSSIDAKTRPVKPPRKAGSSAPTDGGEDGHWESTLAVLRRRLASETAAARFLSALRASMSALTAAYDEYVDSLGELSGARSMAEREERMNGALES